MTPETVFLIANYGVLPFWLLLLLAPGWRGTQALVHAALVPIVIGIVYAVFLVIALAADTGGGFATLGGVMTLFTVKEAALAGWLHYLVFDLFVGAWEVRDARRRGLGHGWVVGPLVLTLVAGPIGLLGYLALRAVRRRGGWSLDEGPAQATP